MDLRNDHVLSRDRGPYLLDPVNAWSVARLEAEMRVAIRRPAVKLALAEIGDLSACIEWGQAKHPTVTIDPFSIGLVKATLHELLHYVLRDQMTAFDEALEEVIIEAFTDLLLDKRIASDPKRWRWWRNAIARKLKLQLTEGA